MRCSTGQCTLRQPLTTIGFVKKITQMDKSADCKMTLRDCKMTHRALIPRQNYDKLFAGLKEHPKKKVKAQFFLKNLFSFQKVMNPLSYI
jgi:hypothetical protein